MIKYCKKGQEFTTKPITHGWHKEKATCGSVTHNDHCVAMGHYSTRVGGKPCSKATRKRAQKYKKPSENHEKEKESQII
jgi:O-acetyl-ADP-ribose deacetylase (regulator of RNase III)